MDKKWKIKEIIDVKDFYEIILLEEKAFLSLYLDLLTYDFYTIHLVSILNYY